MSLLLVGLALSAPFTFKGGDGSQLCAALAVYSGKPVVAFMAESDPIRPFTMSFSSGQDIKRLMPIKASLKAEIDGKEGISLYRSKWPTTLIPHFGERPYLEGVNLAPLPKDFGKGGLYTLTTSKGEAVRLAEFRRVRFSKPLSMHWMFGTFAIQLSVNKVSERQLLDATARAIGAKLHESTAAYSFDFDPSAYRSRAVDNLTGDWPHDPAWNFPGAQETRDRGRALQRATIALMSDADLTTGMETPTSAICLTEAKSKELQFYTDQIVDALSKASQTTDPQYASLKIYQESFERIDWTRQSLVVFSAPGTVGNMAPIKGTNGAGWQRF